MNTRVNNLPVLRTFRKQLRNNLTPAEAKLWTHLKQSQLEGRKFRRQHSIGFYILDFYCPSERLAIELDGAAHDSAHAQEYDRERGLFLEYFGIKVLRFENKWVFQQTEGVLMHIKNHFGWRAQTLPLPRGSTPQGGGGFNPPENNPTSAHPSAKPPRPDGAPLLKKEGN
ncbi:MAG: hypothetical protein RL497_2533 [Pseudomonadota bacterium]|jgi:very-short-patch-repair endonuclease